MPRQAWALYLLAVLIWGSTWLVIRFQLGVVAPEASVIYRFALAAALLFAYVAWHRMRLRYSLAEHGWLAMQGIFLFCINYLSFYHSELSITSGLVALICSGMAFINIFGMRLWFGHPVSLRVLSGSLCGLTGIMLVFWPEVAGFAVAPAGWTGIWLAVLGTFSASAGNLASVKLRRLSLPLLPSMAFAMSYGVLFSLIYALLAGVPFGFDYRWSYVAGLLYLVLAGSIAAFLSYLTLISKVGADKAAYVNVAVPVVALLLSTLVEGFQWQLLTYFGVALGLAGNLLVMLPTRQSS